MRRLIVLLVVTFAAFSAGCIKDAEKTSEQIAGIVSSNALLKNELDVLKIEVQGLEAKAEALNAQVAVLKLSEDQNKTTWFNPTDARGFGRVDANVGYFLVTLENVEAYLDGQRVTLLIGNPNNVTFSGFQIKASWVARLPDYTKLPTTEERTNAWKAYMATQQVKVIKLTDTLRPGIWNKVTFTIAPAKAEEFGKLGIAIITNEVVLAGGR